MQQTENLKLNLIETGDPISPIPINENAQKIEAALDAQDARLTVLEAKYIVSGTYIGDGQTSQFIDLGFTPKAVVVHHEYIAYYTALAVAGQSSSSGSKIALEVVENGFKAYNSPPSSSIHRDMNESGQKLNYIAFA